MLGINWPYLTNFLYLAVIVSFMQKIFKIWKIHKSKNPKKVLFQLQSDLLLQYMVFLIKVE